MIFTLPNPGQVRGEQLVDEINASLSIDIREHYKFIPPDKVEIIGFDSYQSQIDTLIQAHVPDLAYFQSEKDNNTIKTSIKTTAASAVGVALTDLTQAQIKALVAILLWKAGAIEPDLTIKPLADWVK